MENNLLEKIVSLCKRRGFIFPGSEIYGGIGGFYDFGPLGAELKFNIKQSWWKSVVHERDDVVGLSAAIIMNPKAWEASGHVGGFSDPLVECKKCHSRFRVDNLPIDDIDLGSVRKEFSLKNQKLLNEVKGEHTQVRALLDSHDQILNKRDTEVLDEDEKARLGPVLQEIIDIAKDKINKSKEKIDFGIFLDESIGESEKYYGIITNIYLNRYVDCPTCKNMDWDVPRQFNLMFKTFVGPVEDTASVAYLRPETAGGIFLNFKNVLDTMRVKIPFGIAQIGRAFRNEINPKDYIFRTREFEQMELEYFVKPDEADKYFKEWVDARFAWYKEIGLNNVHKHEQSKEERAHYSSGTVDIEYKFPFGQKEIEGIASRGDFDLKAHSASSGQELMYYDSETKEKFIPHVVEPSAGVDRIALAVLCDAYHEDGDRVVLKLHPKLAPYKVAVFPLLKNKPELIKKADGIYRELKKQFNVVWDDRGNIGKRYYSQDEIGTPYCITVDFDTLEKDVVTVRDRDTTKQESVAVSELVNFLKDKLK